MPIIEATIPYEQLGAENVPAPKFQAVGCDLRGSRTMLCCVFDPVICLSLLSTSFFVGEEGSGVCSIYREHEDAPMQVAV